MATATFWQRGETIDRINDTAKTIPANTIQAIGKRIGVVAMEAAPGQKYSVNVVGVYSFPKKASEAYAFCVCTNCPCPSGTNSYTAKYNDSERKAK